MGKASVIVNTIGATTATLALLLVFVIHSMGVHDAEAQSPATVATCAGTKAGDEPFAVKLELLVEPELTASGRVSFVVAVDAPEGAILHWVKRFPVGAFPLELTDNSGKKLMVFVNQPAGDYGFIVAAQLPSAEPIEDAFSIAEMLVKAGHAPQPPPVVTPVPPVTPEPPTPDVPPFRVTSVTYVYEKDNGAIPPGVAAALDKLNRQGIVATAFEDDTPNAAGQVPEQYKIALPAAVAAGLPALVVQAGASVVNTVKAPTTEQQVLEASK